MIFDARTYHLGTCSLLPLEPDGAMAAAHQLASLDPWLTLGYQPEKLTHYLQQPDVSLHTFLVLASGQPAGVVCCRFPWMFGPFLELLALYPQFQGQGLGREIIGWLENRPALQNLWTTVSAFNLRARRFYTKLGFVEVGVLPDLVRTGFEELLLRKIIRTPRA